MALRSAYPFVGDACACCAVLSHTRTLHALQERNLTLSERMACRLRLARCAGRHTWLLTRAVPRAAGCSTRLLVHAAQSNNSRSRRRRATAQLVGTARKAPTQALTRWSSISNHLPFSSPPSAGFFTMTAVQQQQHTQAAAPTAASTQQKPFQTKLVLLVSGVEWGQLKLCHAFLSCYRI